MRFLMIVKATKDTEAGVMPTREEIEAMGAFNNEMIAAGVLLDGAGLQASSKGARVRFRGGDKTVIDGPFAETKELIAGYWLIQVKNREEALAWALKSPNPAGEGKDAEIELRQLFEIEDFPEETVPDGIAKLEKDWRDKQEQNKPK